MINILTARDAKIKASAADEPGPLQEQENAVPPLQEPPMPPPDRRGDLYPGYPWSHDTSFEGTTWFTGTVPENWRVYKKGSEWLFGVQTFEPLLWYWRQLKWPSPADTQESMSWLELAIDFHAATHIQLCSPDRANEPLTAESAAKFFAAASRRLSDICNCSLVPPAGNLSQVPVLTSLGLGRCAGINPRPRLLVPQVVHRVLFIAARSHTATKSGRLRAFPLDIGVVPAPIWICPSTRRRISGKQTPAASSIPEPKMRRVVKSHKETVAGAAWSEAEQQELDACTHWRDRHRVEKRILHNRSAVSKGKHFIMPFQCGEPARCSLCNRSNPNFSKLILEHCGGGADTDTQSGSKRVSVQLEKRVHLVNEYNAHAAQQHHRIALPASLDDELVCSQCGYAEPGGWRRLSFFRKRTCPMAP